MHSVGRVLCTIIIEKKKKKKVERIRYHKWLHDVSHDLIRRDLHELT